MNDSPPSPTPASRRPPFLTPGRVVGAIVLYVAIALVPPSPLERPLALIRLLSSPAPERVAVPVVGVRPSDLRDSWGGPRGGGRRHEGIDIFAPRGARVLAAVDGIVSRVGTDRLGGLVVWQLGPGGQMHYYAHLDRPAGFRPGDRVSVGDTLGYVGTTGNARGGPPHLHYGIYTGGGAIDPFPLLTRAADAASAPARAAEAPKRPRRRDTDAAGGSLGVRTGHATRGTSPSAPDPAAPGS